MRRHVLLLGALFGAVSAGVVVALTYLGWRIAGFPFPALDIFNWAIRVLPAVFVNTSVDSMVNVLQRLNVGSIATAAKKVEQGIGILQFLLIGVVFGIVLAALVRRNHTRAVRYGVYGGLLIWAGTFAVEAALGFSSTGEAVAAVLWLAPVLSVWGGLFGHLLRLCALSPVRARKTAREIKPAETDAVSRRQFLHWVGWGSAVVVVTAAGVSVLGGQKHKYPASGHIPIEADASNTSGPARSPTQQQLAARIKPVPGTRPELTSNADFYRVDIDTFPPELKTDSWRLEVGGLLKKSLMLTIDDIRSMKPTSQVITLECISNPIGGNLTSTALLTGTAVKEILAEAGLKSGVRAINMKSADGYFESMPIEEAMDDRTILVYQMNEQPLPVPHGFPLRVYIPNHFGMKNPKWLVSMEAADQLGAAYWVDRGWSQRAIVKTTSVIDVIDAGAYGPGTKVVPMGGIAYAGARGISAVEVQVDGGAWQKAELRDPPLSPLTWVQWRFGWNASIGRHTVRVRAYDGSGKLQDSTQHGAFPDGATGLFSKDTTVQG
jgi:DMSO/TMAO reductase YedYZ molybdopterin-dependent catalytic subunit